MNSNNPNREAPWISGPKEILLHGLALLDEDSEVSRRLAIISIDNAVELIMKTYLGLPRRITNIQISRNDFQSISESFPALLDALEEHCSELIDGIELGEIEWYHRLRNELYHNGNGLTVERNKVMVYAELAKSLFTSLFGRELSLPTQPLNGETLLGAFMNQWATLERNIGVLFHAVGGISMGPDNSMTQAIGARDMILSAEGIITKELWARIDDLRDLRNSVIFGQEEISKLEETDALNSVREVNRELEAIIEHHSDAP